MTIEVDDPDDPELILLIQLTTAHVVKLQRENPDRLPANPTPFETQLLQKLDGVREAALQRYIKKRSGQ